MGETAGLNLCEISLSGLIEHAPSFWIVLVADDNDVRLIRKENFYPDNVSFKLPTIVNNVEDKINREFKASTACRRNNADTNIPAIWLGFISFIILSMFIFFLFKLSPETSLYATAEKYHLMF